MHTWPCTTLPIIYWTKILTHWFVFVWTRWNAIRNYMSITFTVNIDSRCCFNSNYVAPGRHAVNRQEVNQWFVQKVRSTGLRNILCDILNYVIWSNKKIIVISVSARGLAPTCAGVSAGVVMAKFVAKHLKVVKQTLVSLMIWQYSPFHINPDSKVHGANMGPIWGRQDLGGPMLAPWTLLSGNPLGPSDAHMHQ